MPKKLQLWNIPRTDTRDRCGRCLMPFGTKIRIEKFYCKELAGSRFPKVCAEHRDKLLNNK